MYVCVYMYVCIYVRLCRPIHLHVISAYFSPRTIEDQWWVSCPCGFATGNLALSTYWVGMWVGLRVDLEVVAKKKLQVPGWNRTPGFYLKFPYVNL
jgi:hypothetical protein